MSEQRAYIENILDDIGCPRHLRGYQALIEAIDYQVTNPGAPMMETYEATAKKLGKAVAQTERNMRHAISVTLAACEYETLKQYFGNTLFNTYRVTNMQFVVTVAITVRRFINK